jgi:hypothetical protein
MLRNDDVREVKELIYDVEAGLLEQTLVLGACRDLKELERVRTSILELLGGECMEAVSVVENLDPEDLAKIKRGLVEREDNFPLRLATVMTVYAMRDALIRDVRPGDDSRIVVEHMLHCALYFVKEIVDGNGRSVISYMTGLTKSLEPDDFAHWITDQLALSSNSTALGKELEVPEAFKDFLEP